MTFAYQREIAQTWFDRREDGRDAFDRFIYVWIAFNAAVTARYGAKHDREKVVLFGRHLSAIWEALLREDGRLEKHADRLAELSPIYSVKPGGEEEVRTIDPTDASSVMLGIYAVRNNLFHGDKQFNAVRDNALVKAATGAMERIFVGSGLYGMASEPGRDLTEPLSVADADLRAAG